MLLIVMNMQCQNVCRNPTLKECADETHTFEMGIWESTETPETL
jgi:hypothetical protein